jgi:hypothetical protein
VSAKGWCGASIKARSLSIAAAKAVNPKVEILPMEPLPNETSAVIGVAAGHGEPVEFGGRNRAAQPFMTPAGEAAAREVPKIIADEISAKLR